MVGSSGDGTQREEFRSLGAVSLKGYGDPSSFFSFSLLPGCQEVSASLLCWATSLQPPPQINYLLLDFRPLKPWAEVKLPPVQFAHVTCLNTVIERWWIHIVRGGRGTGGEIVLSRLQLALKFNKEEDKHLSYVQGFPAFNSSTHKAWSYRIFAHMLWTTSATQST